MKNVILNVPDERAEEFARKLAELMKDCGVAVAEKPEIPEVYNPDEGDFVAFGDDSCVENLSVGIFKEWYDGTRDKIVCYAHLSVGGELEGAYWNADTLRPATEAEKEALIKALAKNKKRWNPDDCEFEECETYEAIRTFEDALDRVTELKKESEEEHNLFNSLLFAYYHVANHADQSYMTDKFNCDVIAFIKLRIIAAAINDGWEPKFTTDEYRYYPWFVLYTQEEIDGMDEEDKEELLFVGGNAYNGAQCGLSFARSGYAFSYSITYIGARLAFKTRERAEYAGRQFIELYAAMNFRPVHKAEEK